MKKEKKKRIHIYLSEATLKKGKKEADKREISLSQLLAIGLKREIEAKRTLDA